MNELKDAVAKLQGNSSLKPKVKKNNNKQKSMMINKDAIEAFRVNSKDWNFSDYVNGLILDDMKVKGWIV